MVNENKKIEKSQDDGEIKNEPRQLVFLTDGINWNIDKGSSVTPLEAKQICKEFLDSVK